MSTSRGTSIYRVLLVLRIAVPRRQVQIRTATVAPNRSGTPKFFLRRFDELAAAALGERNDFSI